MSNSKRAKERWLRRKHLTKHQRDIMASQHWGDSWGQRRKRQRESDKNLAALLGLTQRL